MSSSQPPKLPTWFLNHFGSRPNNDPVIGDLAEQYEHGRSRLWYWRQVFAAVVVSTGREIRNRS